MKDIAVKWTEKGKPLVYEKRGVRWIQLTRQQVVEFATAGIYYNAEVMAYLTGQATNQAPTPATKIMVDAEGPLTGKRVELYRYLESMYGPVETIPCGKSIFDTEKKTKSYRHENQYKQ